MPEFMAQERRRLAQSLVSQGYPRDQIELVLQEGVPTLDPAHTLDILTNMDRGLGGPFNPRACPGLMNMTPAYEFFNILESKCVDTKKGIVSS